MYNHNKAQQSSNRVHISWNILYILFNQEKTAPLIKRYNVDTEEYPIYTTGTNHIIKRMASRGRWCQQQHIFLEINIILFLCLPLIANTYATQSQLISIHITANFNITFVKNQTEYSCEWQSDIFHWKYSIYKLWFRSRVPPSAKMIPNLTQEPTFDPDIMPPLLCLLMKLMYISKILYFML